MAKGNVIVGQSGGPTAAINASLVGVIEAARRDDSIGRVLGMRYGVEGLMQGRVVDLSAQPADVIEGLVGTPSSALGSCRHKLQDDDLPRLLTTLRKHDVRELFMIGGNDTMDTIHRLTAHCRENGHEIRGVGIPKTVDNDLYGTDHTPGYPSAARYVALSVKQAGMLARDMKRVDQFVIFQTVGRSAGWLPAASALARRDPDDAPHLIYCPERPWERDAFLQDAKACYDRHGWCSIVVGEGVTDAQGRAVSDSETTDKFDNVEFGAMGGASVAMVLHRILSDAFGWRGEFQVTESLQMCAADRATPIDLDEARMVGQRAVELAAEGRTGVMVTLVRQAGPQYKCTTGTAPLEDVAVRERPMDDE